MSAGDWKAMLKAAQEGELAWVKYHLNAGVNPNYQHPEFLTTPLVESIEAGHVEIVKCLLEHGASTTLKIGFSSETAFSVARKTRNKEIVKLVKAHHSKSLFSVLERIKKWRLFLYFQYI